MHRPLRSVCTLLRTTRMRGLLAGPLVPLPACRAERVPVAAPIVAIGALQQITTLDPRQVVLRAEIDLSRMHDGLVWLDSMGEADPALASRRSTRALARHRSGCLRQHLRTSGRRAGGRAAQSAAPSRCTRIAITVRPNRGPVHARQYPCRSRCHHSDCGAAYVARRQCAPSAGSGGGVRCRRCANSRKCCVRTLAPYNGPRWSVSSTRLCSVTSH
jgi:hypothetical protein